MTTLSLTRALVYLQARSLANAVKVRVRRLKQPKYLAGAVVGAFYMYWWLGRALFGGWGRGPAGMEPSAETLELIQGVVAVILFQVVAGIWIFGGSRASLQFSEAELAFLLPAPLSRKMLVRYKLLRAQLGTLVSALFFTLFTGRMLRDGHAVIHVLSWWLVLTVLNLHGMAASFTMQRLAERGLSSWRRRLIAVGVVLAVAGAVVVWFRAVPPPPTLGRDPLGSAKEFGGWLQLALSSGPGAWLLLPFRWLVQPWFATGALEFLVALGPVALLLALHYWWVERCDVSFEEASLNLAQKRADMVAAFRAGKRPGLDGPRKPVPSPFRLAPTGFAPVALMWKNLVFARLTPRRLGVLIAVVFAAAVWVRFPGLPDKARFIPWLLFTLAFGALALLGGTYTSSGLRRDLGLLDVLKGYPLPGWQVVLGELLGPAAVMLVFQWLAALGAAVTFPAIYLAETLDPERFTVAALSAALVVAPLNLVNALIPSAATLLFPAWAKPGRDIQQPGFEAMGQRMLFGFAQLALVLVTLLPAALLGLGAFALANWFAGPLAGLPAAALLAALVLAVEAWLGVRLLGKLFDNYDASAEQ